MAMDGIDIDAFVNGNARNIELEAGDLDAVQDEFERGLVLHTDGVNDDGFPVLVYTSMGKPVAWIDLELGWGYVGG
jgi:hypothetical protein